MNKKEYLLETCEIKDGINTYYISKNKALVTEYIYQKKTLKEYGIIDRCDIFKVIIQYNKTHLKNTDLTGMLNFWGHKIYTTVPKMLSTAM